MTSPHYPERTAILVDGSFYRYRSHYLFGDKPPQARADEMYEYCLRHLRNGDTRNRLYRIFYYDSHPLETPLYHPLFDRQVKMSQTNVHDYSLRLFESLSHKRKVALRLGTIQEKESGFRLTKSATNKICRGDITREQLTRRDFKPDFVQKGVDMMIGMDIASLADKHLVDQIILISGDSDFVPAAKYARREGIDFVLDPMWQSIRKDLVLHIDGLHACTGKNPDPANERLHVDYVSGKSEEDSTL